MGAAGSASPRSPSSPGCPRHRVERAEPAREGRRGHARADPRGYVAAFAGKALADGEITGEEGDTFEAGELGEREVGENGVVIVGPPTVFNADNIDDCDF